MGQEGTRGGRWQTSRGAALGEHRLGEWRPWPRQGKSGVLGRAQTHRRMAGVVESGGEDLTMTPIHVCLLACVDSW